MPEPAEPGPEPACVVVWRPRLMVGWVRWLVGWLGSLVGLVGLFVSYLVRWLLVVAGLC